MICRRAARTVCIKFSALIRYLAKKKKQRANNLGDNQVCVNIKYLMVKVCIFAYVAFTPSLCYRRCPAIRWDHLLRFMHWIYDTNLKRGFSHAPAIPTRKNPIYFNISLADGIINSKHINTVKDVALGASHALTQTRAIAATVAHQQSPTFINACEKSSWIKIYRQTTRFETPENGMAASGKVIKLHNLHRISIESILIYKSILMLLRAAN